ncbi:hypothetical protein BTI77_07495 [Lactobacillus delbrueckii subsp. bulgaricus]|nr:hypothetical protein [Lactobacillus delbrueckii subsp. bulgaricus]
MMATNFYAVVVLYNTKIEDSITCNNLLKIKNHHIDVIIVDNSTGDNDNYAKSKELGFVYLPMHGNVGLSKGYNSALDYLKDRKGVVVWFDDDTHVTQEYFDALEVSCENYNGISIFTPVIQGQDKKYWSPNKARFFKNVQLKDPNEEISDQDFNAINSCTACRLSVFDGYRFDERLFLDQVDQKFFDDQRTRGMKFLKLNVVIHHDLSLKNTKTSEKTLEKRYILRIRDFKEYCKIQKIPMMKCRLKIFLWGLSEYKKNRRVETLKFFMKQI